MARRKPGLHKNLSEILDGARIPEEARGQSRFADGEDQPTSPAQVQRDVRAGAADNLVPPGSPLSDLPIGPSEVQQDVRARAADNLVPPEPDHMGPRWVIGDEAEQESEKKRRGLFGVLRRIGRLVAGSEAEASESEEL